MEQALNAVFPQTRLQSCIMHLIRNSLGYASRKECRAVAAAIKLLWLALRNRYYPTTSKQTSAARKSVASNKHRRLVRRFLYQFTTQRKFFSRRINPTASVSVRINSQISDHAGTDSPRTGGSGAVHRPSA
ncbi:hypothetical protein CMPELA_10660 [Cupriavidus necator]